MLEKILRIISRIFKIFRRKKQIPKKKKITEEMIAKAKLTNDQARVIRYYFDLPTAGRRTEHWVEENISNEKFQKLLREALEKLQNIGAG